MGEYDAVWVFIISAIFVGFYIYIEARPKGSTFFKSISNTVSRFFRKR
jgi:predicted Zn-dependent protease